ncbi:unnamed protein product [Diatraea saccharalis]|uniref:Uncharacterized protein n=1 Tax=Diatraea saccharalis TaxID=40085 RepID=A0A9N9RAY6_9NEOP|nr:unnamed protein product [Diatraea saccharalis]
MDQKSMYHRNRVAEEAHLLSEEKWILEALDKIKKQRNCLQIERLQLESMKNQLKNSSNKIVDNDVMIQSNLEKTPVTFTMDMMQKASGLEPQDIKAKEHLLVAESVCNKEELNLNVTNSSFSQIPAIEVDAEEYEDEYDEEDGEDLLIDMNMFMHGTQITSNNNK